MPPPLTGFLQAVPALVVAPHFVDVDTPADWPLDCPPCCQHLAPGLSTLRTQRVPDWVLVLHCEEDWEKPTEAIIIRVNKIRYFMIFEFKL